MVKVGDIVEVVDGHYTITRIGTQWRVYGILEEGERVRLGEVVPDEDFETVRRRLFSDKATSQSTSTEWKKHYGISLYRIPSEHVRTIQTRNIDHKSLLSDSMEEVDKTEPDPSRRKLRGKRSVSNLYTIA